MTYSSGSLIEATDYNGFISTNAANINAVWGASASGDLGWGETALSTVSSTSTITATQWATLVNQISTMANQTGVAITSRTAPVAGNTIAILANVNTDITNITTYRGNASASGTQYTSWSGTSGKTGDTTGVSSIVFTHTVTFPSALAARYFWNAGGLVKIQFGKSSTGNFGDPEWNDLAQTLCGAIFISGRINNAAQTIAGTSYTGTTKVGGSGTPNTLTTTTGWYQMTTSNTLIYKQFSDTAPYTSNYIQVEAKTGNTLTTLDLTTTWYNAEGDTFSGGTAPSGATLGTGPATVVTYYPPSSTYLTTASWGTPTVAATTT